MHWVFRGKRETAITLYSPTPASIRRVSVEHTISSTTGVKSVAPMLNDAIEDERGRSSVIPRYLIPTMEGGITASTPDSFPKIRK